MAEQTDLSSTKGWLAFISDAKDDVLGNLLAGALLGIAGCIWIRPYLPNEKPLAPQLAVVPFVIATVVLVLTLRKAMRTATDAAKIRDTEADVTKAQYQKETEKVRAQVESECRTRTLDVEKDRDGWKLNFERLQEQRVQQGPSDGAEVTTLRGRAKVKAIGLVGTPLVNRAYENGQPTEMFDCHVHVNFVAFAAGVPPSPAHLRLTNAEGTVELARLELDRGNTTTACPHQGRYRGQGSWESLVKFARSGGAASDPVWQVVVEVHLPTNEERENHVGSAVRLDFELTKAGYVRHVLPLADKTRDAIRALLHDDTDWSSKS